MLPSEHSSPKRTSHYSKIRANTNVESRKAPSAEDIKQSKDRINASRNIFPFYSQLKHKNRSEDKKKSKKLKELRDDDEEKDKCEDSSDGERIPDSKSKSIVHSRIASYELPYKNEKANRKSYSRKKKTDEDADTDDSCRYAKINKCRRSAVEECYQDSVTNYAYDGFSFGAECNDTNKKYKQTSDADDGSHVPTGDSQDKQIIYRLQNKLDSLKCSKNFKHPSNNGSTSNIIIGNKDVLKLLSNKHLANLNIKVEKGDHKKDNRWRDGSFRASKLNIRSSFRSSKRKKKSSKHKPVDKSEEKGTSDSTLKENESDSDDEVFRKVSNKLDIPISKDLSSSEYIKNKFPEYAKVNKRKMVAESDIPSRSLSTSPMERAPVVKKICAFGTRIKKDSDHSLTLNPVKKADSFKGSRVTRRNSFLYNTRAKTVKDSNEQDSFVKTQAVRLRRKTSRNMKNSEYRVSVTIRPSTVANLANKFNSLILENQTGKTSAEGDVSFEKVSLVESTKPKGPRYYISPRASFKRKYRHKASKASKETKEVSKNERLKKGIDNNIYYAEDLAANRRSLSNSMAELNMKDLFEDPDYNKTDEEKVCAKIKTALRSGKFKGETDDSEDDLSRKSVSAIDEDDSLTNKSIEESSFEDGKPLDVESTVDDKPEDSKNKEGHFKTDSIDSGISADDERSMKYNSSFRSETNLALTLESIISEDEREINTNNSDSIEVSDDKEFTICETNSIEQTTSSLAMAKSVDSGISLSQPQIVEEESKAPIDELAKDENEQIEIEELGHPSDDHLLESSKDDSYSEVSSIYSDVKERKNKNETGIYSSLLSAVKGTAKKSKNSDRTEERESGKRKWYKRNKSKERKLKDEELSVKKEGRIYEKWTFKRKGRSKSKDRKAKDIQESVNFPSVKSATGMDDDKYISGTDSEVYQDCSLSSDQDESLYGNVKFASRSRSREKRMVIKMRRAESRKLSATTSSDTIEEEKETVELVKQTTLEEKSSVTESPEKVSPLILNEESNNLHEEQIYEPHTPTKVFPPPPKTAIPSPPSTFKRFLTKNRLKSPSKKASEKIYSESMSSEEKTEMTENIYENLYSPDLQKLKRNREKLEGQGIKPNCSFLWSESAIATAQATITKANLEKESQLNLYDSSQPVSSTYDKIGDPELSKRSTAEDSGSDGHNYTEIQNSDSQTVAYDDVGAPSAVSYDEIAAPSSCGYDDIRPPSLQDLDIYKTSSEAYDPVNPPKSDSSQYEECGGGVVTAQLAVVREDQQDTLSYLYDDISMYNASIASHSYEPVCPPNLPHEQSSISVITEAPETNKNIPTTVDVAEDAPIDSDGSEYGAHEVFSYKLTRVGTHSTTSQELSNVSNRFPDLSSPFKSSKMPLMKIISDNDGIHSLGKLSEGGKQKLALTNRSNLSRDCLTQYEKQLLDNCWEDVSESEPEDNFVTIKTKIPILRNPRQKRLNRLRVKRRSWTQGVRDVAAINYRGAPHVSHKAASSSNLVKIQPHHSRTHITHIRTSKDHVITYSLRQKPSGDLDGILRWKNVSSPPTRTPSKLSTSSKSSNSSCISSKSSSSYKSLPSSSASSCCSSFSSSFSSHSSCTLPPTPIFKDEEQVYVTSSSTIILLGTASDDSANMYDTAYEASSYYNASNVSSCGTNDYESAKIRSIYYEDNTNEMQEISCFVEEGTDTDNEEDNGGHYEAIYEVISPADDDDRVIEEEQLSFDGDLQDHPDDDSFDSDDSDEAYSRLRPPHLEDASSVSRDRMESFSSDLSTEKCQDYLRHKYDRSQSYQSPHSINKIAEAANSGMKKLRRNWSMTKNEVRTGLSKMKKKSNFSGVDMKSTEDILSTVQNSSSSDKSKWFSKNHFRRKSQSSILPSPTLSLPSPDGEKDKATFYLTLTIASNGQDHEGTTSEDTQASSLVRRKSQTPSVSSVGTTTSCDTSVSSRGRPLSTHGSALFRNTSSGSNSGTVFRPRTAPPAPPADADLEEEEETSKDRLAQRLNLLLAAAPLLPPGKRVLRSCDNSSSESSPVSLLMPTEERLHSSKVYSYLPHGRQLAGEVANSIKLNAPHTRTSVASSCSHGSSEGYIRPSDIASAPPPLPARPTSISGSQSLKRLSHPPTISPPIMVSRTSDLDSRNYLDLNCEPSSETEPAYMSSHFADEPLYQFYTAKVERAALYQCDSSEDDYEVINDGGLNTVPNPSPHCRPTAMELVTPADGRRTLWCELPEVVNSGILSKISSQERKVQEAMFEVITSEASYLKSLEVLVTHFMNCPDFSGDDDLVISRRDTTVLFSDILPVKKCSELFLADLEKRWQESYIISSITDIILKHSTSSFNVYVKYCSNQIYQDRKLRSLKESSPRFVEVLNRLECSPICQSLAMHSFLMLPMQRITRLPLLLDAIFNRLEYGSVQWEDCKSALASLTKIVAECNEGARKMERMEEMLLVSHQLDFREVKAIPLISASRWLVKKGEITRLTWREGDAKLTFGRKISKHLLYFFLFTDLLVVTKKKSEDQHMVLDYCPRNMVQVLELESADKFPGRLLDGHKNLIIMTMLQNHETKTVEMVLSCPLESDRTRWMEAVTPRISENPDERIYEEWDCPQVQVDHSYVATQPDEVSLEVSDVINVLKKTADGWYQGERLRDSTRGWFPGNHTIEIASAHVRARNLRQRYRLLAISGSIIDELKKEKEKCEKEEKKRERKRTITIKEVL